MYDALVYITLIEYVENSCSSKHDSTVFIDHLWLNA